MARAGRRLLVAGLVATVLVSALMPGMASADTSVQHVAVNVTLDVPGTSTVNAFDPAQGTLTRVSISITVDVLVQACVENLQGENTAPSSGTASGSLTVQIPSGANATVASADAALPAGVLTASNGSADCAGGFSAGAGRFPTPVSAPDVAYAENTGHATRAVTLSGGDVTPFIGPGTVTIAHTPVSDTNFALPATWDDMSVATGDYAVDVTYTFTPAPAASSGSSTGSSAQTSAPLSRTGVPAAEEVVVGGALLLVGATVVVIANRRRRLRHGT